MRDREAMFQTSQSTYIHAYYRKHSRYTTRSFIREHTIPLLIEMLIHRDLRQRGEPWRKRHRAVGERLCVVAGGREGSVHTSNQGTREIDYNDVRGTRSWHAVTFDVIYSYVAAAPTPSLYITSLSTDLIIMSNYYSILTAETHIVIKISKTSYRLKK